MRRPATSLLATCATGLALAAAGCGGSGDEPPEDPEKRVQISIEVPEDRETVRSGSIDLQGTVSPAGARVIVDGRAARVSGSTYTAEVDLDPGTNVIDVLASAPETVPAFTALRVDRIVTVEVPDVTGDSPDDASERLTEAGLRPDVRQRGGLIEDVLPAGRNVCATDPEAGEEVDSGTRIRLDVSKIC